MKYFDMDTKTEHLKLVGLSVQILQRVCLTFNDEDWHMILNGRQCKFCKFGLKEILKNNCADSIKIK